MRSTLFILIAFSFIAGCDGSRANSNSTFISSQSGMDMTVKVIRRANAAIFECAKSLSGSCFFIISSSVCISESKILSSKTTCTKKIIDRFELSPGDSRVFETADDNESFLHCVSAIELKGNNECIPS